ncbi:MAG: hypothetical protein K1X70_06050 [Leptospirales bacterium]|nr:hypothetical protein [Leptospirales bacterium]HNJ04860.1 hypothetical protein [Leptospiraceae bacterium]HNN58888.1 hypothetical protein [Leptospiraceae bacterium]HNN75418.1 hypothetical protein [Leptospiraceae bacterium]
MDAGIVAELSRQSVIALGRTWPNPSVACVIQSKGQIFSGATEAPGRRHAEIVALDLFDQSLPRDADGDLYVTLEPCSKFGRTPPCTKRLANYPNLRLHIGNLDPSLSGEGLARLRESGLQIVDDSNGMGREFLEGFIGRTLGQGPRFHLKVASCDGIMGSKEKRIMVSSEDGIAFGQMLRAKLDAVLVGPRTIFVDRPGLEARTRSPLRMKRTSGQDPFVDAIIANDELAATNSNQPLRVFVLGRPFPGAETWFEKQKALTETTGREPLFLSVEPWPGRWTHALPPLSHPSFMIELRDVLADRGLGEVLVEGGAGLFHAIMPGLGSRDRLYHLERSGTLEAGPDSVRVPSALLQARPMASYHAGEEKLGVYHF